MIKNQNCLEFRPSSWEISEGKTPGLDINPATNDTSVNGLVSRIYNSKSYWIATGTVCDGQVQGSLTRAMCLTCEFLQHAKKEEGVQSRLKSDG